MRSGVKISPQVEVTQLTQGSANPRNKSDKISQGSVGITFDVPLMRGRGSAYNTLGEQVAFLEEKARYFDLQHIISTKIVETIATYWKYKAAQNNLDILVDSEKQAELLLKQMEILIKEGERPATELKQLQAHLADKRTTRILAEQTLQDVKHELGIVMGLPFKQVSDLPPALDQFPKIYEELPKMDDAILIDYALKHRMDLKAMRNRKNGVKLQMDAAKNNMRPQLDASVTLGRIGVAEGTESDNPGAVQRNQGENSAQATVSFRWPVNNNVARGVLHLNEAAYQKSAIEIRHLKRTIRTMVVLRKSGLLSSINTLKQSLNAVMLNKESLLAERQKLQLGFSTTIDLTLIQNRLTDALIRHVSAQAEYAQALAVLRYETSTLMTLDEEEHVVTWKHLSTVPFADDGDELSEDDEEDKDSEEEGDENTETRENFSDDGEEIMD